MDIKFHCDEEKNFYNGQLIRTVLSPDYSIEPHNHDFYEINIVLKGIGTHQIENECFRVKAGDVFLIPPMIVHAYYDTENLDVYHILLHKDFIAENKNESTNMPGFLQFTEIEPFLRQHFSSSMFLHLSVGQMLQLKQELDFVENTYFDKSVFNPLKYHTMWKIIYWLSYLLSEQIKKLDEQPVDKHETNILNVLEYIHKHYADKITVDLLCKKSFMSKATLFRWFYNMCRCTPMQYLNKYRCEKALEMMSLTDWSKTEIAHRCGFYDLSHMERVLKKC